MVRKIQVACDSRSSRDFLIIARTDARSGLGLDEALRRGEAYAKAGADILFIESPESVAEMETIGKAFETPLVANMTNGGVKETGLATGREKVCQYGLIWGCAESIKKKRNSQSKQN